jgi:cell wall-associated NlpC family hydrolase
MAANLKALVIAVLTALAISLPITAAYAAPADRGPSILSEAQTRTGDWYAYGTAGPSEFDCSGLVYWAARQVGISLPRDTYGMLASGHLARTYHPVAGDLAFYGTGHVELVAHGHDVTFGAQQSGTQVGYHTWNSWWRPTMFFRVW